MISKESSEFSHVPVLYEASLKALNIQPQGIYVDCTTGGAGHSAGILQQLSAGGTLICLDRDSEALAAAETRLAAVESKGDYHLIKTDFAFIKEVLEQLEITRVNGILADLGVSSHQLDMRERGFSYHHDGPLDMRMDQETGPTAAELVNTLPQNELAAILRNYGEERYADRLAGAIVQRRRERPFSSTGDLAAVLTQAMPGKSRKEKHPAKRSFQALRIAVNGELDSLEALLAAAPGLLAEGGRLAIISFHSLEDRLVKEAYREWEHPCNCPVDLPCVCGKKLLGRTVMGRRGIVADDEEAKANGRARSARLRVFERNGERTNEDGGSESDRN